MGCGRISLSSLGLILLTFISADPLSICHLFGPWICVWTNSEVSSGKRFYTGNPSANRKITGQGILQRVSALASVSNLTQGTGLMVTVAGLYFLCQLPDRFNHIWNNALFKKHLHMVHIVFKMLEPHHSYNQGKCWALIREGRKVNFNNILLEAKSPAGNWIYNTRKQKVNKLKWGIVSNSFCFFRKA